jgi:F-type H+-transporting ATPase subunit delta
MAELSTYARPYAEALFRIARAGGQNGLEDWATALSDMGQVAAHPDMLALIANPKLSAGQLFEVFTAAVRRSLTPEAQNLVNTLIDNDRLAILPAIVAQFNELKNAHEGAADALIETAFPLEDDQVMSLVESMEKKFGVRLKPTVRVDQNLIGGVRVSVGDRTIDTSVRAQLERMQAALSA